jgi:tRNA threonylcarbamoyl adenosine modification protein YeaZ
VLVLGLDTASAATSVAVGRVVGDAVEVLVDRTEAAANRHVECLVPMIDAALAAVGSAPGELDQIVAGVGPGPFTGLRVGLVTAVSLAQALGIQAIGACSLDAVAFAADRPWAAGFAVLSDARRREVYWARYGDGRRLTEPAVGRPADVAAALPRDVCGAGAVLHEGSLPPGTVVDETAPYPSAATLLRLGTDPAWRLPLRPLYLRRPDATPPGPPKRVTP